MVYDGGRIVYHSFEEDSSWTAAQFHFHSPSEHQIDGKSFDLEMHNVLAQNGDSGQLLVLGVLFALDENAEDIDFITSLHLANIKTDHEEAITNVHLHELFAEISGKEKFNYQGSLTTPPCSETVEWFVVKEPLKINKKQLDFFKQLWEENPEFAQGNGNNR